MLPYPAFPYSTPFYVKVSPSFLSLLLFFNEIINIFSVPLSCILCLFYLSKMYSYIYIYIYIFFSVFYDVLLLTRAIAMICQLKKLQSWLEGLFIMQHSVMELVVELLAVLSLSLSVNTTHPWSQYDLSLFFLSVYYVGPSGWK